MPVPGGERQRLIWWKRALGPGMGDLSMPWGTAHEDIYVLGQGWDREASGQIRAASVIVTDGAPGSRNGAASKVGHPTPKPLGLMEQLIVRCPPGVIADPFAGSGSTLIAARNLGRRAIGVECHEPYAEIAARRLAQDCLNFDTPTDRSTP